MKKFYLKPGKKTGQNTNQTRYALRKHLRQKKNSASIINGREFKKSQETLNSKPKCLRYQGKGKRPNRAQPHSQEGEDIFCSEGKLESHNGVALTNVNFKNLSEHLGFKGRQDHYNAYVENFANFQTADGSKVVQFEENPTKTRQGGLRNKSRSSPQQMWSTDSGERDPVRLFEQCLARRPEQIKNSGPLYLAIIPRPTTIVWYAKSGMGEHRIGQIMKAVASCLPKECSKKITNHSTRKTVVAKLKEAGQPRHKIIQVTGHEGESSLDDYDQTTESERRQLSHITSGYVASTSSAVETSIPMASCSTRAGPEALNMNENFPANPYGSGNMLPFFAPSHSVTMATKHQHQAPFQVFNQCVFNISNNMPYADSLRSPKRRKRHVNIDSDSH